MLDNKLYKTRSWVQYLQMPDGNPMLVQKFEIRTLLTAREILPIFERPAVAGRKPRRIILPFFSYNTATQFIEGEEGEKTSLDERMVAIVNAVRENGFDDIPTECIDSAPGAYVHFHFFFAGAEQHAMGFIPDFDEMEWCFMVRSEIIDATK